MRKRWQIEALMQEMVGFTFLHSYEAALPFYECWLEVRLLQRQALSPLDRMVLACAAKGFDTIEAVDLVLGAGRGDVRSAFSALLSLDLLAESEHSQHTDRWHYRPTDRGFETLSEDGFLVPIPSRIRVIYDAELGRLVPSLRNLYITSTDVTKRALHVIPAAFARPSVNDLDWASLRRYLKEMQRIDPKRAPQGELHDVVRITNVSPVYRQCDVVAFDASDHSSVAFRVFDGDAPLREYDDVLSRRFIDVREILPLVAQEDSASTDDRSLLPKDLADGAERASAELSELQTLVEAPGSPDGAPGAEAMPSAPAESTTRKERDALKKRVSELESQLASVRPLEVSEHRPLLEKALKHARERVLIVSPWLTRTAFDAELLDLVGRALRRGITVYIGWGIPARGDNPADARQERESERVIARLEDIASRQTRGTLKIAKLGDTHEKVLISDTRFAVVTSFNWGSFRGDPNRGFRQERGIYFEIAERVEELASELVSKIDRVLTGSSGQPPTDANQA